jgi:WD40 repeat protein
MPDGWHALSACDYHDSTLRLWDLRSGKTLRTLEGHTQGVHACLVTPDGRRALSASRDNTLRLWDLQTGETVRVFDNEWWGGGYVAAVTAYALTPDGRSALSSALTGTGDIHKMRLWDLETGEVQQVFDWDWRGMQTCLVTRDGSRIVSGSFDNTVRVWDLKTGQNQRVFHADLGPCTLTPDGCFALFFSNDNLVRLWDVHTGQTIAVFQGTMSAAAVTYADHYSVAATSDALQLKDSETDTVICEWTADAPIQCYAASPVAPLVVAGDSTGRVHVLRLEGALEPPRPPPELDLRRARGGREMRKRPRLGRRPARRGWWPFDRRSVG